MQKRLDVLFTVLRKRPAYKWAWAILSAVGFYDLIGAQFVSQQWAEKMPTVNDFLSNTTGFLPWWGWVIVALTAVALACIEYAVRLERPAPAPIEKREYVVRTVQLGQLSREQQLARAWDADRKYGRDKILELRESVKEIEAMAMGHGPNDDAVTQRFQSISRDYLRDDTLNPLISDLFLAATLLKHATGPDRTDELMNKLLKASQRLLDETSWVIHGG
ncbi:MAG: hypothetical protein K2Y42_11320 [Hyphomicrobium sp.]|jgi:hypothetical protein|uniref:hypothetical protein n=1 Tax=Hyphomicrobium sp. TaxID=82 RepID=UPI0025C3CA19|nr:hypothetical protein [Hyphomicrobium sp.]MBX9863097.1 hypothetical protein [Hyphomicrobium sp.]MBX9863330.1 hypothetical protein [Hyphomicrobium sp.]